MFHGPRSFVRYRQNLATGPFKWVNAFSDIDFFEDDNHSTVLRDFYESGGVCLRNEVELWYSRSDSFHEPYQNWADRFRVEYNEDVDIWDSISVSFARGVYEEEPYKEYTIEKPARITDRVLTTINGNYRIKQRITGGDKRIWLWRWVTQYTFP